MVRIKAAHCKGYLNLETKKKNNLFIIFISSKKKIKQILHWHRFFNLQYYSEDTLMIAIFSLINGRNGHEGQ